MTLPSLPRRIAIVGAGFTGTMLAAHLLRLAEGPTSIHLIERAPSVGTGLAYSTANGAHLLNVRAYNMSAFPDDRRHFLRWLWAREGGRTSIPPSGHAFVSRALYGTYIQDVLREAVAGASPDLSYNVLHAETINVVVEGNGVRLQFADGTDLAADIAVLCVGHFPPLPPPVPDAPEAAREVYASDRFVGDPWNQPAVAAIDPDAPVLILGTGLTMVDTVLSLADQGHCGPITALSRRGLLPITHEETRPFQSFVHPDAMPRTVLDVMIALRADVRSANESGLDWRSAFDALRPHHHRIWKHLPLDERRRFLRHARPYWDVHRHRMAPEVAARIDALRRSGQLTIEAGRLRHLALTPNGVNLTVQPRNAGPAWTRTVGTIINATGTNCDYGRIRHPLVCALLERGLARPDALRLGLDVTEDGALIRDDGIASDRLYALGPVSRAPFWEMMAVPELRGQCADAARYFATFSPSPGTAG